MRAALAAIAALLLLPAASPAATIFGSRLNHDPTTRGCTDTVACTLMSFIVPTDPNGDPDQNGSPVSGVITKFRVRANAVTQPGTVTLRVGDVSRPNPMDTSTALATVTATGPTVAIPVLPDPGADTPVREFDARVPIKQGQHLGLDPSPSVNAVYASSGDKFTYSFEPPLVDGQGARGSSGVTEELLVQATVEPDADGDGFGDETQDQCPTQATTQGPCQAPPPPKLTVGGATVSGGRIAYTLSRDAVVSLALARQVAGRKVKGRCVKPTSKNRRRKACRRFTPFKATFGTVPGAAGANSLPLPKHNGRKLPRGRYRLTITAALADGTKVSATAQFRVT